MAVRWLKRKWRRMCSLGPIVKGGRGFRSDAALEAIAKAGEDRVQNLVLYNYPSFSGAFSALFAHLFHSRLKLPCILLPFSSVEPFRLPLFTLHRLFFFSFQVNLVSASIFINLITLVAAIVKMWINVKILNFFDWV